MLNFCLSKIVHGFKFCGQMINAKIHHEKYPQIAYVRISLEKHIHHGNKKLQTKKMRSYKQNN